MGNNASKNSKALQSKDSQGSMGCNSRTATKSSNATKIVALPTSFNTSRF